MTQGIPWSFVELPCNGIQSVLMNVREVHSFREVLSQESVGIFVRSALPQVLWIAEVDVDTSRQAEAFVICLLFDELKKHRTWWLLADGNVVDLCTEDPGKDVDLYINSNVRTIVEVWEGDLDMRVALRSGSVKAHGLRHLVRTMPDWFGVCLYKEVRRGDPELMQKAAE